VQFRTEPAVSWQTTTVKKEGVLPKKLLVVTLVLVFTLALCTVALAADPIPFDGVMQGGYLEPTAGQNPHGDYIATSNKCKTCHAVHGAAAAPGEALLRSSKADACIYCHVSTTFSIKHPYGTDPAAYTNDYENNHASSHGYDGFTPAYAGCVSCHAVHGAGTWSGADGVTKGMILRDNPGGTVTSSATGSISGPVTNLDDFCRDCHDGTTNGTVGTEKCSGGCHADGVGMQVTKLASRNGVSHVMTSTLTGSNGTSTVAYAASTTCRSCHKGAAVYANGNSFPHITSGADFLYDGHTNTSPLDRVCLQCHQNTGNTAGVGLTF
jgi:predicted CXXCH cytochrome family protein